jgi:hypothetical protein
MSESGLYLYIGVYPDVGVHPEIRVYPDIGVFADKGMNPNIGLYPDIGVCPDIGTYRNIRDAFPFARIPQCLVSPPRVDPIEDSLREDPRKQS